MYVTALMIAQAARKGTRTAIIPNALLCQRTHLKTTGLSDALKRLSQDGYEFRMQAIDDDGTPKMDRRGRPVFAARGHETIYRVPEIASISMARTATGHDGQPVDKPP
jgi:hypothetical protein